MLGRIRGYTQSSRSRESERSPARRTMKDLVMWVLAAQLSALLCLVRTDDDIPISDYSNMYQREIVPSIPVHPPLLIQGEPMLSPRGRRPVAPGLTDSTNSNLKDFPPGRPSRVNIDNICEKNRHPTHYGSRNLPQTGFSHLGRQGKAINEMEDGFRKCCRQSNKLHCADEVWTNSLEDFCNEEFSVKTRHYHCCKKQGSHRETCFGNDAPNPSYDFRPPSQERSRMLPVDLDLQNLGTPKPMELCPDESPMCMDHKKSRHHFLHRAFPPGEPKSSNIHNICKLRKYRVHADKMLSQSGHNHPFRQARAINRMENEFKKCCKMEDVACALTAWENVLAKFCKEEGEVKHVPHECCQKRDKEPRYRCFASAAPFPEYDREVEILNLSNVTEDIMEKMCGESKLLTKKRQVPLLVSGLKNSCCSLPDDQKLGCAEKQKEKFIKTLCGPSKASWKDTENCCSKGEQERAECFSFYLQNISMAVIERKKEDGIGQ